MPAVPRDQILPLAVGGAAAAALGTVPLHRLPRPVRVCYVLVPAVLTTAISYAAQGAKKPGQDGDATATASVDAEAPTVASASAASADLFDPAAPAEPAVPTERAVPAERSVPDEPTARVESVAPVAEGAGLAPDEEGPSQTSQIPRLGLSVVLGALVAGAGSAGIWVDHRVEAFLRSRGVPAPRLVIGLAQGLLTVLVTAADDSDETDHTDATDGTADAATAQG